MDHLVPNYIKGVIYSVLVEAFSSEQHSRMVAMEAATTSAKDMLKDLNLMYNRARQAAITQEITEIVSGANSLNK
jgi:F-type H+-transporting ATPase subunit gamma